MNKLAVLAFALLLFFSTMLWYLANGSLNDYLKSQVLLQSQYYTEQPTQLLSASFTAEKNTANFSHLTIDNIESAESSSLLSINSISATLAPSPIKQLNTPSIQNKTTTLVQIAQLTFDEVEVWSEVILDSKNLMQPENNLKVALTNITTKLATDFPALYPQISAKLYAKRFPERSEALATQKLITQDKNASSLVASHELISQEANQAVIESKAAKQEKRILGKAQLRVKISDLIIDKLTLHYVLNDKPMKQTLHHISLGSFGEGEHEGIQKDKGLASNQLGGEILRRLLTNVITIEKDIGLELP